MASVSSDAPATKLGEAEQSAGLPVCRVQRFRRASVSESLDSPVGAVRPCLGSCDSSTEPANAPTSAHLPPSPEMTSASVDVATSSEALVKAPLPVLSQYASGRHVGSPSQPLLPLKPKAAGFSPGSRRPYPGFTCGALRPPIFSRPPAFRLADQTYGMLRPDTRLMNRWSPLASGRVGLRASPFNSRDAVRPFGLEGPLQRPCFQPRSSRPPRPQAPLARPPVPGNEFELSYRPAVRCSESAAISSTEPCGAPEVACPKDAVGACKRASGAAHEPRPPHLRRGTDRVACETQENLHSQRWDKVFALWDNLRSCLLPLSTLLRDLMSSVNRNIMERALLQRVADTTALRYISSGISFFRACQDLQIEVASCTAPQLVDALYSLQADRDCSIHVSNSLKAVRWMCKLFEVPLPAHSPLTKVLEVGRDHQRREALPLPGAFIAFLERRVLQLDLPIWSRAFAGSLLVCVMSSLRFADSQHVKWSSLSLAGCVLRGLSYRTQSCSSGMPFGVLGSGLLSNVDDCGCSWIHHYLSLLGSVWDLFPEAVPDVLFFQYDEQSFTPMSYCQTLAHLRQLLQLFAPHMDVSSYTLHSLKVTALSAMSQLDVPELQRRLQGHHRDGSMQLYARDDLHAALRAQRFLLQALARGFVPVTPQARGAQQPLPALPLDLRPADACSVAPHARFGYYDDYMFAAPDQIQPPADHADHSLTASPDPFPGEDIPSAPLPSGASTLRPEVITFEDSDGESVSGQDPEVPLGDIGEWFWVKAASGILHVASSTMAKETENPRVRTACGCLLPRSQICLEPSPGTRLCLRGGCRIAMVHA